jgi:ornithine--oxo-acid transaminase
LSVTIGATWQLRDEPMPIDLVGLLEDRRADKFALFERHLNVQLLRLLRTLGFAVDYVRAEGPYLFDAQGNPDLDLLSGFGAFALGRNHPIVIGALEQVLRARLAGLVQLDVPLLAGLLAERLTGYMPWLQKLFFCNSGAEAVEAAIKFSRATTGRSTILYCDHAFHGLTYGALSLCGHHVPGARRPADDGAQTARTSALPQAIRNAPAIRPSPWPAGTVFSRSTTRARPMIQ